MSEKLMKTYLNKTIKTIVSALFIMPILVSCKGDGKVLSIGKPEFIREFPKTIQLKEIDGFNCNEIGFRDLKVVDSLLIISKADTWSVYSLDGSKKYGECMRVGNGPGEFADIPLPSRCHFFTENDSMFVEAMTFLNQMNIISGDGIEGKTICVGKKLDDIEILEKKSLLEFEACYITALAWEDGFGAVYFGFNYMAPDNKDKGIQIQFFDWEGNPKCLVELPYYTDSFDIDFTNNIMYVVDSQNDKLIAYDATEIVKCLKS